MGRMKYEAKGHHLEQTRGMRLWQPSPSISTYCLVCALPALCLPPPQHSLSWHWLLLLNAVELHGLNTHYDDSSGNACRDMSNPSSKLDLAPDCSACVRAHQLLLRLFLSSL